MAQAVVASGSKVLIQLGDGASPEVFAHPCGITTKAVNQETTVNEVDIPDCSDEDAISWIGIEPQNRQMTVTGSGVLDKTELVNYRTFFALATAKNVRVNMNLGVGTGGGYWAGGMRLTTFNITGEKGQKIQVEITLRSDGEMAWTDQA